MRGKPQSRGERNGKRRSIPACAGEAPAASAGRLTIPVYPRVCGGSLPRWADRQYDYGLSPRVRGKRPPIVGGHRPDGSIPACAGEARRRAGRCWCGRVYPRVCGGSMGLCIFQRRRYGLSPRVRGKHRPESLSRSRVRSIPACAGEAGLGLGSSRPAAVYPRVCGGSGVPGHHLTPCGGLSPRVRGKPPGAGRQWRMFGSIPACAGEAAPPGRAECHTKVYPRVCGGSQKTAFQLFAPAGLSPRVRGKQLPDIPECA